MPFSYRELIYIDCIITFLHMKIVIITSCKAVKFKQIVKSINEMALIVVYRVQFTNPI